MLEDPNYQVLGQRPDISIAYGAAQLTLEVFCNNSRLAPQSARSALTVLDASRVHIVSVWPAICAKGTARTVPFGYLGYLPVVVVSRLTVVTASPHAALLETYVRSRKGRGRSCPVSQIVPSRHGQRGDRA